VFTSKVHIARAASDAPSSGRRGWRGGFFDFLTVILLGEYRWRPMHLFGWLGLLSGTAGILINLYLVFLWFTGNPDRDTTDAHPGACSSSTWECRSFNPFRGLGLGRENWFGGIGGTRFGGLNGSKGPLIGQFPAGIPAGKGGTNWKPGR